jgi:hypothetical protein
VPCTFGDRSATRSVVVVGDSMADSWIPTLDAWGVSEKWRVVRLVKDGCPPWTSKTYAPTCLAFRRFEIATINRMRPEAVFVVGLQDRAQTTMESTAPSIVAQTIENFAREIATSRARVFVPQNTPWFFGMTPPPLCIASYASDLAKCNHAARSSVVERSMFDAIIIAAAHHDVISVPVDQLFCSASFCPVVVGKYIVYADDHHFSRAWANYIVTAFGSIFTPMITRR